jgi:hypothetical protein
MANQPVQSYSQVPDGFEVVSSTFWGSPVYRNKTTGQLFCPGYTGNTFASAITDYVVIGGRQTPGVVVAVECKRERDKDVKKSKGADGATVTFAGLQPADVEIKIKIWTPQQLLELDQLRALLAPGRKTTTKTVTSGKNGERTTVQPSGTRVITNNSYRAATGILKSDAAQYDQITTERTYTAVTVPTIGQTRKTITTSTVDVKPFQCTHPVLITHGVHALLFYKFDGPEDGPELGTRVFTFTAIEYLPTGKANTTSTPSGVVVNPKSSVLDPVTPLPGENPVNTGP